ncbi:MAG: hypothetical protein ACYC6B_04095 [Thermoleophilia bacterium]
MIRKLMTIATIFALTLLLMTGAAGCGDSDTPTVPEVSIPTMPGTPSDAQDDLAKRIDALKQKEMTVEVIDNGKSLGKWSQDGKGSWRSDDPDTTTSYTIYNADKKKGWSVNGKSATEIDPNFMQAYEMSSPLLLLSAYASFSNIPRTGGSDDTWEWNVAGMGSLKIEFKGPEGLISKIISDDSTSGSTVLEFTYTNVGKVSASLFELPGDVTVDSSGLSGLSGTSTRAMPSGLDSGTVTIP